MSELPAPDPVDTVRRILALLDRVGRDRAEVLRVEGEGGLAYASGLVAEDVEALLRGERAPSHPSAAGEPESVESRHRRVVDRIRFLRRTRLRDAPDGSRRMYSLAEIAASAGTSAQWLDKMIRTGKAPNLDHAAGIAGFYGEKIDFLVDPPAEALDRVLRQIHSRLLEQTVERQDHDLRRFRHAEPAESMLSELGVIGYAARCLADVPDDTAKPLVELIESIARRAREDRAHETRDALGRPESADTD